MGGSTRAGRHEEVNSTGMTLHTFHATSCWSMDDPVPSSQPAPGSRMVRLLETGGRDDTTEKAERIAMRLCTLHATSGWSMDDPLPSGQPAPGSEMVHLDLKLVGGVDKTGQAGRGE